MNTTTNFERDIMWRVRTVHLIRRVTRPRFMIKSASLVALGGTLGVWISFLDVLSNTPVSLGLSSVYHFYSYAFFNTERGVQIVIVGVAGVFLWIVVGTVRNIRSSWGL